jgi:hypothetical protein
MDDKQNASQSVSQSNQEARDSINKFRFEAASEVAPSLLTGYREGMGVGKFGSLKGFSGTNSSSGYLLKRMIEAQEKQMNNQGK